MVEECPLGIVEHDGACIPQRCRNWDYCRDQTAAWRLPWNVDCEGYLVVSTVSYLDDCIAYWNAAVDEASGAYQEHLDTMGAIQERQVRRWMNEVHAAGWHEPEPLPYKGVKEGGLVVDYDLQRCGFAPAVELNERDRLNIYTDIWGVFNGWDVPDAAVLIPTGLNLA